MTERRPLTGWIALVSALAFLNYASRLAAGKTPKDEIYTWSLAVSSLVLLGVVLTVVLVLARHDLSGLLALRRPSSWRLAGGLALVVMVVVYALSAVLDPYLHPGREQGLTPTHWDPSRAAPFALNFVAIVIAAPIVEELTFRGLGYSVLRPFGRWTAIVLVGVAFGLAHGLVQALPILVAFGAGLAYMRDRTDSVYPGMILHAAFNALVLTLSVTT